ncbi:MAG: superinfection immunity protein [Actinomycetota bacterium]|nr:superinfection immunity protein [Actinomycetota bacterium]
MNSLANSSVFWVALIAGLLVLYILPSLIGAIRRVEGLGWLIVVNLLPTGIGWLAAMVLAIMLPRREPPAAYPPAYNTRAPGQRW